ncbi:MULTISPECIES: TetR/AcrR family transcriptional regulator [Psychrobacter]|jgi:AcrR family transcriptional regulator|uniref:TetR/AcrR family transcriptional regulator n=1 Tax=Psychrobacter namhaensis TaxID=292734 RepID=A0ABW8L7S0_9GAMM|nr:MULTISPECIES: TetR/AcrR family transcriptional regulator [unclassified Psychrobacter]PKG34223.1 TetR family transcriptional regulator [Psychrobacter sp. Sarcosine-3u-12]PKG87988.1 TetR family transcriptional regulator [Psychrobacter sp. Sarcosine-02u-2]|tara:strand:+ start:42925 stop:43566 length:642 start_codon:yes stop_codon:yes gene_type:complete
MAGKALKSKLRNKQLKPISAMRPATLNKLEKAVLLLFSNHDPSEVSMIQIANAANMSLKTLYNYFGDKQTIIYTILNRVLGRLAIRMIDHLQGIDSVKDRLRKTLWVFFDFIDKSPDAMMVLSTAVPVSRYREIAIYDNKELVDSYLQVLRDGQEQGILNDTVPLFTLFDVFIGFISRLGLMHIIRRNPAPLNDNFDELFIILWRAISKPEID